MSIILKASSSLLIINIFVSLQGCSADTPPDPTTPKVVHSYVLRPNSVNAVTHVSGRIQAMESATLGFEVAGAITQLDVKVGDRFSEGDILATLDDERYRLIARQREAEVSEAAAMNTEKHQDYERQFRLSRQGHISARSLGAALAAKESAESHYLSSVAARNLAQRDLRQTTLTAPFDGFVTERQAEPSEQISAGQPVLRVISETESFEVEAGVPESLVNGLVIGSHHRVSLPALGEAMASATLTHVGLQPSTSNDYPLLLKIASPVAGLRPGMTAIIDLIQARPEEDDTLAIPLTSLVYAKETGADVLRINGQGVLEQVPVEIVSIQDGYARIRGELESGERIVDRGAEFVRPGQSVSLLGQGPERYN